jgi:hypothetical protein
VHEYDIETCQLETSKHFKNTWMRKWDWDYHDLRDAIRDANKTEKVGKEKYEIYVRKRGEKKLIAVYQWEFETLFVITGSEG